jgi:hypothetical protein
MGAGRQWQPAGVGAYTGVEQPEKAPEDLLSPIWPDGQVPPPPRMRRRDIVIFVLIVSALVAVSTVILLAVVVPQEYPQHVSLRLDAANDWKAYACIPTWSGRGGPGSVSVSFNWTSHSTVDLVMVPNDLILQAAVYNVTGTAGSDTYLATPLTSYNVDLEFVAFGAPVQPPFVNISVSYNLSGHVLAPPTAPMTC